MIARVLDDPLPPPQAPPSKTQREKAKKAARRLGLPRTTDAQTPSEGPQRNIVTQFVMNLPDSAITFLDAFRGVLSPQNNDGRDLSGIYGGDSLPVVHCYCFTREPEREGAEMDIRQVCVL